MNYENMNKITVFMLSKAKQSKAKQSKAKQSKAKPLLYILTNNFKFYILQFFNTFKLIFKCHFYYKNSNINLVKTFLALINFGSLSEEIKSFRFVINKLQGVIYE